MSPRFSEALQLAEELHRTQVRKDTDIPYIGHLLSVAGLVIDAGGDEDMAIAALLHDAVEDQGGAATLALIRERFGDRVADMVDACTDSYVEPKPEWRPRKEAYIGSISHKSEDACRVSMADKLHNARAILQDFDRIGDAVFDRFTGRKDGTLWYYRALVEAFGKRRRDAVWKALDETVSTLERRARGGLA